MKSVQSSTISQIGYDPDKKVLSIIFKSGREYEYQNVSLEEYKAFENSGSLGKHFHTHIKEKYSYRNKV